MPRYLTPPKIGLLALISVYVDARVASSATIPVLSFLTQNIIRRPSTWRDTSEESLLTIDDFQKQLTDQASSTPGRSLWDVFVRQLWLISNFDALHVFFDSVNALLGQTRQELLDELNAERPKNPDQIRLSRNSPLGIFVRRSYLEFTRLPIHDSIKLWKEFVAYREATYLTYKKRYPTGAFLDEEVTTSFGMMTNSKLCGYLYADVNEDKPASRASTDEFERIIAAQVELMQKTGQRVPREIRDRIQEMITAPASISNMAHYGNFLDAWKAGDYPSAFDGLHRYFDYTMNIAGKQYYQYALLNMAFLHADFGAYPEAIAAMKESISMAREHRDHACLNFSLAWLYNLGKRHPEERGLIAQTGVVGADRETLAFIKGKARDSQSWSLLCTCLLAETQLLLENGESVAVAFENLAKVIHLNQTKSLNAPVGPQMMISSSLYARLGLGHLDGSEGDIFSEVYADKAMAPDRVQAVCRGALRLARSGKYDEGVQLMRDVDPEMLRILKLQKPWAACMLLLQLQRAIFRGDVTGVAHHLSHAKTVAARAGAIAFEVQLCGINFKIRQGECSSALTDVESLLASPKRIGADIQDRLRLMLLKARIFDKAGVPQKGFSIALRAASAAYRSRFLYVLYQAVVALCRILLGMREFAAASQLLESIMPPVLECEDCALAGTSFLAMADAEVGMAGEASTQRNEYLSKALDYLERAFHEFSSVEDVQGQCEAMAKRAMIMRVLGDMVLANDYAAKYLAIKRAVTEQVEAESPAEV